MIDTKKVEEIVRKHIADTNLFLVEIKVSPHNEIEVLVDKPTGLSIEECANISRAVEEGLNREAEDFELTVGSPGLSEPLKVMPQYQKLYGKQVEVLMKNGQKLVATLLDATPEKIMVEYTKVEAVEGKKRKQTVEYRHDIALEDVKWTKCFIKV